MNIKGSTIVVLGGWGLVGYAVCRRLMDFQPGRLVVTSLLKSEAEEAVARLREEYPNVPAFTFEPWWGNIFTRSVWKDSHREAILSNSQTRREYINDIIDELHPEILEGSALYRLIVDCKADAVIDCVNTATAIAYQDIYSSSRTILKALDTGAVESELIERMIASLYVPQLTRHIQILLAALKDAASTVYLKVGTSGTGGMGLNIPYTHSEERPSRVLLAKSAMAGAQSLLLFLAARTPNGPLVKEIKPSATIAWKGIGSGVVKKKGKPIEMVDMHPSNPITLAEEFDRNDTGSVASLEEQLQSVFIDTGENGIFSRAEFETISAIGQMEIVTPEEIAEAVVHELRGGNTGLDVIAGLDSTVMGPTYRGGVLRDNAIAELHRLEEETGFESVAFEMLGPPRLSKLLFEANLLRRICGSFDAVIDTNAEDLSRMAENLIVSNTRVRSTILSVGIGILLPDGRSLLRGTDLKIPISHGVSRLTVNATNIDHWASEGWVDLRTESFQHWQKILSEVKVHASSVRASETSSATQYNKAYWNNFQTIDEGRLAAWIFEFVEHGWRFKR